MRFLGIGTLELGLIILLGLLLVGPVDMVRMAGKAGLFLRQFKESDVWRSIQGSQRSIKRMGQELIGDDNFGLDSIRKEIGAMDLGAGADRGPFPKLPDQKSSAPSSEAADAAVEKAADKSTEPSS